jgi:hypothetical protein
VREILRKAWPQETVREVVREVVKQVPMPSGKPSRLVQANEYIFGINREENPGYGLRIYQEEAENGDATAAAFLGQVY